ncbi:uncharacterized protein [Physcomitrium patens]|uniref:uncharacterized protein isoform X2 n=1 Tax=Physcomitrium patens TaxID=3218 RepID=UPI003CCDC991
MRNWERIYRSSFKGERQLRVTRHCVSLLRSSSLSITQQFLNSSLSDEKNEHEEESRKGQERQKCSNAKDEGWGELSCGP